MIDAAQRRARECIGLPDDRVHAPKRTVSDDKFAWLRGQRRPDPLRGVGRELRGEDGDDPMTKTPRRALRREATGIYYFVDGKRVEGAHDRIRGFVTGLRGDVSGLCGNVSGLRGYVSGLSGNVTGLCGDVSGLSGNVSGLRGDVSGLCGDVSGLRGNVSGLRGDVTLLRGDVTLLRGDVSGLRGNVDECDITDEMREQGVDIETLVKEAP